ncbi:MAG TPA: TrmJ/YjtD family RNA methyltransferase [Candidatus Angelobacter sp.]|nr:TrmJ/YjtD family RNA methyltransferase [Candidatus Angelobacter sp.]
MVNPGNLRVVLVATRNPLNIGAAARAMSNLGFLHLRVVNPYEPSFREARSAVGAEALLANAEEYQSVADAVADCALVIGTTAVRHREIQHSLLRLEEGAGLIRADLASERVAILFGSEKVGLSNNDLSHCHWLMRIPTREEHISMNLGQAVAICLYELIRDASVDGAKIVTDHEIVNGSHQAMPAAGDLERLTEVLLSALRESGYLGARPPSFIEEKVRRLVLRLNLPAEDVESWLGMMRQILWKLKSGAPENE